MTAESAPGGDRYVVLGDVVDSRSITERDRFRETFAEARERVARRYESAFVAGPSVLKGIDELGGVLSTLEPVYDIVVTLQTALHPHAIRIAVASGEISVGPDGSVAQMDGEAFHRATELLEAIERDGLRFGLDTGTHPLDTAIAGEINLLVHVRESWTDRQREVVTRYERAPTQRAVASELEISQQAVSNVLQSASWPLVETIEGRLRETLTDHPADRAAGGEQR
ncbi:SatD family protein [Halovivax gelatinilyticus]|uniref:SatD family protein n=1 Tax=Halovivax gelatinilyticus TaxID=2961597 RepID=UPI0020CA7F38|nr:SatD family protein [Halovivax gelatinilyticus]